MNQQIFKLRNKPWQGREREREILSMSFEDTIYTKSNGLLLAHMKIATVADKNMFPLKRTVDVLEIFFLKLLFIITATLYSYS